MVRLMVAGGVCGGVDACFGDLGWVGGWSNSGVDLGGSWVLRERREEVE